MPHLIIEYSANLETDIDIQRLVDVAHGAMIAAGPFEVGGIRTRAARRDAYAIADQHPDNGFVHMSLTIGPGRGDSTTEAAGTSVFDTVAAFLSPLMADHPIALSFYIFQSQPPFSWKKNNLPAAVAARETNRA